jgi:hypothetical protein
MTSNQEPKPENPPGRSKEARRDAYVQRVRNSAHRVTESVRRSEEISDADYAIQVNAKGIG